MLVGYGYLASYLLGWVLLIWFIRRLTLARPYPLGDDLAQYFDEARVADVHVRVDAAHPEAEVQRFAQPNRMQTAPAASHSTSRVVSRLALAL